MDDQRQMIRAMVRGLYDQQKLRIATGNRVVSNFKTKLGIAPGEKEDENANADKMLKVLKRSYEKITDGVTEVSGRMKFEYDGVISDYSDLVLMHQYQELLRTEEKGFSNLKVLLSGYPIYEEFLEPENGVGKAMAGVLISEIDIHRAKYPSSLWKYAGLDVVNGEGRSRKKHHREEQTYEDGDGETQTKTGLTFNPFLKTKAIGVLGPSFIKQGVDKSAYAQAYYDKKQYYMHRGRCRVDHSKERGNVTHYPSEKKGAPQPGDFCTLGHLHNMALRFAVKMFLKDLYLFWRKLEGLPVADDYHTGKLGHNHNDDEE